MQTVLIILAMFISAMWLLGRIFSRHKAEAAKAAEKKKYAAWDEAFSNALQNGKSDYHAVCEAVKAVGASPAILKVWDDAYNQAISNGIREYKAKSNATAAAKKAAHP